MELDVFKKFSHKYLKENGKMIKYRELTKQLNEIMELKKRHILENDFNKAILYKEQENNKIIEIKM